VPAFCCLLLTAAAIFVILDAFSSREPVSTSLENGPFQLSVDGFHAALEIDSRSSYVPRLILGV
jgi:hypothetical protein